MKGQGRYGGDIHRRARSGFAAKRKKQISLMKWIMKLERGRARSNGHPCPCFLKPPFMAVFPWLRAIS